MTSYGGYKSTSYGGRAGAEDGGGFMGGSQQGSQGQKKSYVDEFLRPVTIKQLLDCKPGYNDSDLQLDGQPITQVTFVGQIRSINPQVTNITYKVDDGTGMIDVKKWIDPEKAGDNESKFVLDTYVRVLGRIQSFNGKLHIGAHHVRAIDDFNEVNYHLLEATYVHLCIVKGSGGGGGDGPGAGQNDDSMFVDGGHVSNANKTANCSRLAQRLYDFLASSAEGTSGVNINEIVAGTGMSPRDVSGAADELLGQGLVYTTVDDETWAILDY
ncbi:replication factor A protein 2 [Podospora fimiseda]|uniref:Replication factor A protein 2 n=1 Tax=Podospora fimiseda TaxID=252190 RepID=A0AAN7BR19_9PEZI|nr:replication factor A protein 2 [Podospora fimiseda]